MTYSPLTGPESIATVFVEAWARRDAEKLASLFDEDAEFVNVTGLWWHDRKAIQRAHAYGFERIFGNSRLTLRQVKVKHLSGDIAVVHTRLRIDNQTAGPGAAPPAPRNTILSFVVHRLAHGWSCAAAQNTDIVPHMETNVVDSEGRFRPISYRD